VSGLLTFLAQGSFLDPGGGPDQSGGFSVSPRAFIAVLGAGFLIGVVGHVVRSRAIVAFGVALIFGATFFVPVLLAITN
jgi:Flp pilus assembly protein TadB